MNFFFDGMGGGMPGGGFPGGMPERKPANTTELYETLGVKKDATQSQIKKAFHKLSKKHHPDKGGDAEVFKKISGAYEVLGNKEKREVYDEYGLDGLKEGGGAGAGADDIFSMFFGGGGGGRRPRGKRKGEDVVHPISVSLEDLYKGKQIKLAVNRDILCVKCNGTGAKEGASGQCKTCNGQKYVFKTQRVGPGMIQRRQVLCPACEGLGMPAGDRCVKCMGRKVQKEKKILEVYIEKGMKAGEKIVFRGCADEAPNTIPGDVIFILKPKDHPEFKRRGNDLLMEKTITLSEALCGLRFKVHHLDGRTIVVQSAPGEIIKPGGIKCVEGEGMPLKRDPLERGRLFIHFTIKFPEGDQLNSDALDALKAILPEGEDVMVTDEDEVVDMVSIDKSEFGKMGAADKDAYDSDEERGGYGQPQGVQCAQQ